MNRDLVPYIKSILTLKEDFCRLSKINNTETLNIWARWIITHRSLFKQTSPFLPDDTEFDSQLIRELVEKGAEVEHSRYIHDWLQQQCQIINQSITEPSDLDLKEITSCYYLNNQVYIKYQNLETELPEYIFTKLIKKTESVINPLYYIWYTCFLYDLLDGKGLQWAVPPSVLNILQNRLGCDTELFASPFNNHYDKYYSLFPTDEACGSLGNFFTAKDEDFQRGTFQINPPFIDILFTITTKRVLKLLEIADNNSESLTFIYIMPTWDEFDTCTLLSESPFCVKNIILKAHMHYYYQYINESFIKARFGTRIMFLSTKHNCCSQETEYDIISAFCYPNRKYI